MAPKGEFLIVPDPHGTFYNDLPPPPALHLAPYFIPDPFPKQSPAVFAVQITYEAWRHIPSTLIFPQHDKATPVSDTEKMIENNEGLVKVIRCDGSHSVWLSQHDLVVKEIINAAGGK